MTSIGRLSPPCGRPIAGIIEFVSLSPFVLLAPFKYPPELFEFNALSLVPIASYKDLMRSKMLKFALINL